MIRIGVVQSKYYSCHARLANGPIAVTRSMSAFCAATKTCDRADGRLYALLMSHDMSHKAIRPLLMPVISFVDATQRAP